MPAISGVLLLVTVFALKVLENILDGTRILLIQKHKDLIAGFVVFIMLLINLGVVKIIAQSSDNLVLIVAAAAAGIGYILAGKIGSRFFHGTYIEIIRCGDNEEAIREIHNFLSENRVKHDVFDAYNKGMTKKIKVIYASPKTEAEKHMIDKFIADNPVKFNHVIVE